MVNKRKTVHLISGLLFCIPQLVQPPLSLYLPFPPHSFSPNALSVHKALGIPCKNKTGKGREEGEKDTNKLPWYYCLSCYLLLLSSSSRDQKDLFPVLHMLNFNYHRVGRDWSDLAAGAVYIKENCFLPILIPYFFSVWLQNDQI